MNNKTIFGEYAEMLRKKIDISINKMAYEMGYCKNHLYLVEKGINNLTKKTASSYIDYFRKNGCSEEELDTLFDCWRTIFIAQNLDLNDEDQVKLTVFLKSIKKRENHDRF